MTTSSFTKLAARSLVNLNGRVVELSPCSSAILGNFQCYSIIAPRNGGIGNLLVKISENKISRGNNLRSIRPCMPYNENENENERRKPEKTGNVTGTGTGTGKCAPGLPRHTISRILFPWRSGTAVTLTAEPSGQAHPTISDGPHRRYLPSTAFVYPQQVQNLALQARCLIRPPKKKEKKRKYRECQTSQCCTSEPLKAGMGT
jgi:hypothetical protein